MKKKNTIKRVMSMALAVTMMSSAPITVSAASSDIAGHWAEQTITKWEEKGLISGYADGTFRPNNTVTRAEFIRFMNQAFGLTEVGTTSFTDVSAGQWFYNDVAIAVNAGYCSGFPDGSFKPDETVTRAQASVFIAQKLGIKSDNPSNFTDVADIPEYAVPYMNALVEAGYLSGYEDGSVKPNNPITRAEAVFILDKASTPKDVVVDVDDTKIENQVIEGNLIISEKVGEGEVYLDNVEVKGDIIVRGGGDDSIYFNNVKAHKSVIVEKPDVRLQFSGETTIPTIDTKSSCNIAARDFSGTVGTVNLLSENKSDKVVLSVAADKVVVSKPMEIDINRNVKNVVVEKNAENSVITIASDVKVSNLTTDSKIEIKGSGTIITLEVNADGVTVESGIDVSETVVSDGVDTPNIGGGNSGDSSNGSSSGSGGTTTDRRPPTLSTTVDAGNTSIAGNSEIRINFSEKVYINEGGTEETVGDRVVIRGGTKKTLTAEDAKKIVKVFDTNGTTPADDKVNISVSGNSIIIQPKNSTPLAEGTGKLQVVIGETKIVDKANNKLKLDNKYSTGVQFTITAADKTAVPIMTIKVNGEVVNEKNPVVGSGSVVSIAFDAVTDTKVLYTTDGTDPAVKDVNTLNGTIAEGEITLPVKADGEKLEIKAIAITGEQGSYAAIEGAKLTQSTITWKALDKTKLKSEIDRQKAELQKYVDEKRVLTSEAELNDKLSTEKYLIAANGIENHEWTQAIAKAEAVYNLLNLPTQQDIDKALSDLKQAYTEGVYNSETQEDGTWIYRGKIVVPNALDMETTSAEIPQKDTLTMNYTLKTVAPTSSEGTSYTYNVYTSSEGTELADGVTAAALDKTLTLKYANEDKKPAEETKYYVSVVATTGGNPAQESSRVELTAVPFTQAPVLTISNPTANLENKTDKDVVFDVGVVATNKIEVVVKDERDEAEAQGVTGALSSDNKKLTLTFDDEFIPTEETTYCVHIKDTVTQKLSADVKVTITPAEKAAILVSSNPTAVISGETATITVSEVTAPTGGTYSYKVYDAQTEGNEIINIKATVSETKLKLTYEEGATKPTQGQPQKLYISTVLTNTENVVVDESERLEVTISADEVEQDLSKPVIEAITENTSTEKAELDIKLTNGDSFANAPDGKQYVLYIKGEDGESASNLFTIKVKENLITSAEKEIGVILKGEQNETITLVAKDNKTNLAGKFKVVVKLEDMSTGEVIKTSTVSDLVTVKPFNISATNTTISNVFPKDETLTLTETITGYKQDTGVEYKLLKGTSTEEATETNATVTVTDSNITLTKGEDDWDATNSNKYYIVATKNEVQSDALELDIQMAALNTALTTSTKSPKWSTSTGAGTVEITIDNIKNACSAGKDGVSYMIEMIEETSAGITFTDCGKIIDLEANEVDGTKSLVLNISCENAESDNTIKLVLKATKGGSTIQSEPLTITVEPASNVQP